MITLAARRSGLIAAIAPNGRIYVAGQDRSFTGEDIVWFLNKLCGRYRKRDLLIVWDGASIHRSEAVKAFLKQRPGRVHLESLPPYSPDRTADAAEPGRISLESA
ncbi:transposase [Spirosoma utsteinense]|uniref:transposase n=1 Tax=Spirosoma utsteinense TaxID=2585773 RepID=UPI0016453A7A